MTVGRSVPENGHINFNTSVLNGKIVEGRLIVSDHGQDGLCSHYGVYGSCDEEGAGFYVDNCPPAYLVISDESTRRLWGIE